MTLRGLAAGGIAALAAAEVLLRRQNPYRLWPDAFDEASVMDPHPTRGWTQRPHHTFTFHHRYLRQPNAVQFNHLGMYDRQTYAVEKPAGTLRVALFGCTTAVNWELPVEATIAARLQAHLQAAVPKKRVEVMNATARCYSTGQLYQWYVQELRAYRPDVLVYYFNTNHPRRTITFHESGKAVRMHQPVYRLDGNGELRLTETEPPRHPNDMIYLDDQGAIVRIPGQTERTPHRWLRDHLHTYCALEDLWLGPLRLRRFRDRVEIKDIEKWRRPKTAEPTLADLPHQWQITAAVLTRWAAEARAQGTPFLILPILAYYHAGAGRLYRGSDHPWGFDYAQIPERRYLPLVAEKIGVTSFDTYQYAREGKVDTDGFYTHPRYAYLTANGADYHAHMAEVALAESGLLDRACRAPGSSAPGDEAAKATQRPAW